MNMKNETIKRIVCIALTAIIAFVTIFSNASVSEAKSSYNTDMANYLKAFKSEDYAKAAKLAKKLKKTKDTTYKKMSKKQKDAYKKVFKKYSTKENSKNHIQCYMLTDMDGDKNAELIVKNGSNEANMKIYVYTFKKGKAKKIGSIGVGLEFFIVYPGKGLVYSAYHNGIRFVGVIKISKGSLVKKSYGACNKVDELVGSKNPSLKNYMYAYKSTDLKVFK